MFSSKAFKLVLLLLVLLMCVQQSQAGFKDKYKRVKKNLNKGVKKILGPIRKLINFFVNPFKSFSLKKNKSKAPINKARKNTPRDPNAPVNEPFENKILRLHQEIRKKVNLESKTDLVSNILNFFFNHFEFS